MEDTVSAPKIIRYECGCTWVRIDRSIARFKSNIEAGEKLTGLHYLGVSVENPDYMVFM